MIHRRVAPILLAIPAAILVAACASVPPPLTPAEPGQAAPPSLWGPRGHNELDDQMLALAKAEEQIDKLFPNAGKPAPLASKKKADAAEDERERTKLEAQRMAGEGADPCAIACRALNSMHSSAEHLCKLAGDGDGRCEDARGRVRGATARVRSVCPSCVIAGAAPRAPR